MEPLTGAPLSGIAAGNIADAQTDAAAAANLNDKITAGPRSGRGKRSVC